MPGMSFGLQVALLFVLAIPIASITWTVTHEEIFREPREYCVARSKSGRTMQLADIRRRRSGTSSR
jgi:hypothetical protein